jgi:ferrous iron transport protein A
MNDIEISTADIEAASPASGAVIPLSRAQIGERGVIVEVRAASGQGGDHGVALDELHRRLLEFGFVEGARVEVLHEGAIRRDPIAVKLDDMRVALRRRDADDVQILLDRPRP